MNRGEGGITRFGLFGCLLYLSVNNLDNALHSRSNTHINRVEKKREKRKKHVQRKKSAKHKKETEIQSSLGLINTSSQPSIALYRSVLDTFLHTSQKHQTPQGP